MKYLTFKKCGISVFMGLMMAFMTGSVVAAKDIEQARSLDSFSRIVIKGAADIDVEAGKDQKVVVKTKEAYLDHVTTEVKDGVLHIDIVDKKGWSFWNNTDIDVFIEVPALEGLVINGAADGHLKGLSGKDFALDIRGAGDVKLEGDCKNFDLQIHGAGDVNAKTLECLSAKVRLNGAGDADLYASESVDVIVNGVGDVTVYGQPAEVEKTIRGMGDIDIH